MKIEEMIAANRADCSGCSACLNICPKNAITMTRDAEGFAYPKINPDLCIKCGRCDGVCPALNFQAKTVDALPKTFVATYDNNKVLRHSSSGGIFTALSEVILREGGVVFGAAFDKNWRVAHTVANNLDELEKLRGSKYVQSQIGDVYRQVRAALKTRKVLFTGVPCQCAGLRNFLGGDHENLLNVEILCHGTPSPAVWENYVDDLARKNDIVHVNFRSKRLGWGHYIEVNYSNRGRYFTNSRKNVYGSLFLGSLFSRPSCHSCKFKIPNGQADLTLGDAWGIKYFAPEMYDGRGTSVVFVNTPKGQNFFEQLTLHKKEIRFYPAAVSNPNSVAPDAADERRKNFFADFAEGNDKLVVLERYHFQKDNEEINKRTKAQTQLAVKENLQDLFAQIRQTFAKKFLIISSPREKDAQNNLAEYFEQKFKHSAAVYLLQPKDAGKFVCMENFSGVRFDLKDAAALTEFVNQHNIKKIFVEKPLDFGAGTDSIAKWLKACDLPVKFFASKKLEQGSDRL